jgi:hypothetical protein
MTSIGSLKLLKIYRNQRKKIDLTPEKDSNLFLISFQIVICGFIYFSSRYTKCMCFVQYLWANDYCTVSITAAFAAGLTPKCMGQKHTTKKFVP